MNRYTGPWNGALNGRITGRTQEWYKGDQGITYVPSVNPGGGAVLGSGLHGSSGTFAQQQAWQGQQQTTHAPHQQWYSSWQREQAKLWQQQAGAQQPTSPETTTTQVSTPTRSATPNVSRTPPSAAPPPPRSSGTMPPKPPKLTDSVLNAMRVDANLMGKIDEIEPGSDKRSKAEYPTQQREFERYVEYLKKRSATTATTTGGVREDEVDEEACEDTGEAGEADGEAEGDGVRSRPTPKGVITPNGNVILEKAPDEWVPDDEKLLHFYHVWLRWQRDPSGDVKFDTQGDPKPRPFGKSVLKAMSAMLLHKINQQLKCKMPPPTVISLIPTMISLIPTLISLIPTVMSLIPTVISPSFELSHSCVKVR